jgi:cell division protein FtsB
MKKFVQENFTLIVLVLSILGFLKSCSDTREISKLRKEFVEMENRQSIHRQIEGLKSEKRMIQATDRKILDVQRQTEIENEIKSLEDKIK